MNKNLDKKILAVGHYKSDDKLLVRKKFNSFSVPRTRLDEEIAIRLLDLNPKDVLDIGCGNGDLLALLRKKGLSGSLTGADVSQGMIDVGIAKNREENLNINFLVADCEHLPFDDASFDVIIAKHMLYHLPNIQLGIDEVNRCLKEHGKFIITLNSKRNTPRFHEIEKQVCKKWNLTTEHGQNIACVENILVFLKKFKILDTVYHKGLIDKPDMFPGYFASFRDFFEPFPDDRTWSVILEYVNDFVKQKLKSEGKFIETRVTGIIVAEKI